VQATAFAQASLGSPQAHTYSRASNPTVASLEVALAALDGAAGAACFASGMAAVATVVLATVPAGEAVVASDVVYGGTARLLEQLLGPLGIGVRFADTSDLHALSAALAGGAKLVFLETPANPTLKLSDIAGAARLAHAAGALLAVDNTFLTPLLQQPLALGADVAVYSTTKHLEGHNGAVGGAVTARDEALLERLRFARKTLGNIQTPFNAWLTLRGLETLPLRLRAHARSAAEIATYLAAHPAVVRTAYPGLAAGAQATLASEQHRDRDNGASLHGGVVAFELADAAAAASFCAALQLCTPAESLGATRTLVTHPATMTHGDVPVERRRATGISDGLLRISVGLEDVRDIIRDIDQALRAAAREPREVANV
jgi:cystathionine beta-lyase/cystathionine gamma-synthase